MTPTAPARSGSESRRLQTVAATRIDREEMKQLRAVASQHGQSVSNFLRTLVLREIRSA